MSTFHHARPRSGHRRGSARQLVCAAAVTLLGCASAHALTVSQYAHNLKQDASHAGHAIVRVGAQTGHGVVHAAKTVGHDVAGGVRHGYHATRQALRRHD